MIYLFGKKSAAIYSVIGLVFVFMGTLMSNDLVWELSDMFNNLMVISICGDSRPWSGRAA